MSWNCLDCRSHHPNWLDPPGYGAQTSGEGIQYSHITPLTPLVITKSDTIDIDITTWELTITIAFSSQINGENKKLTRLLNSKIFTWKMSKNYLISVYYTILFLIASLIQINLFGHLQSLHAFSNSWFFKNIYFDALVYPNVSCSLKNCSSLLLRIKANCGKIVLIWSFTFKLDWIFRKPCASTNYLHTR